MRKDELADNARAEAWMRFLDGIDVETGEPVDDYGYPETAREAFIGGAEWVAGRPETTDERVVHNHGPTDGPGLDCPETTLPDGGLRGACLNRAETTTATTEDAVEVAYRMAYDVMRHHPGIWHDSLRASVEALADAGLLATARTRPTRDDLILALARADGQVWPDGMDDHTANHMYGKQADAVLALLGGEARG